jgi:uncharacterized protein (DUF342 family)
MSSPATGLRYSIRLLEGGLTVVINMNYIPTEATPETLADLLVGELAKRNIVFGLDKAAMLRVMSERMLDEDVEIAHGVAPQPGRHGEIEMVLTPPSFTTAAGEDGRVDYKNVENISPVKAGDVISRRTPPDPGQPGTNVFGKPIRPAPVMDARHPAGKNTAISDDGREMSAASDGFLRWDGDKVNVLELYAVKGDVDLHSGNVRYDKDVEIFGSVRQGFEVAAGGSVLVYGAVEGKVTSGGTVIVNGAVMGNEANPAIVDAEDEVQIGRARFARIQSKSGRVVANFAVEHSEIRAAGDLILRAGPAMSSVVEVGGKVDVSTISNRTQVGRQVFQPALAARGGGNRREYLRVKLSPPVPAQVHGDMPSDVRAGFIMDLSAGGARVRLPERLKEGDRHRLQFALEGVPGTMWMTAQVVRECTEHPDRGDGRSYGLQFSEIEPAVRESLARFCLAEDLRQKRAAKEDQ